MSVPSSSYSEDIVDRTKDFTGRGWAFQRINNWLQSDSERVLLITGGPGTGKTALAARLLQMSLGEETSEEYSSLGQGFLAFAHFCQAFNDPTIIPLRFIEYLSKHLASRCPPYREALLQAGAQNVKIESHVTVGRAESVTGVDIDLHIGDISVSDAFDRLVRKPLEQLHSQEPEERIVLLVDSLDEAQTININENIMTLIADVSDHSADLPDNVRFLLTSRLDPRVLRKIGKRPQDLVLDLIVDAPDDVNDVRDYAHRRLKMLPDPRRINFATRVAEAAEGNFLYVRYLLDDLLPDIEQVEDLSVLSLPIGLDGLYRRFIERELTRNQERWEEYFRPLLGVISVSRGEGLNNKQLSKVIGLKQQSKTDDILRACNQYLAGNYPEGPFRIYHQSFREFLLSSSEYPVYPEEAHEAIADTFLSLEKGKWGKYGWRYLPFHLSNAGRSEELRSILLDFEWMQSKLDATDVQELISDYDYLPGNAELNIVQGAIRLASHILVHDRKQLAGQLLGRLQSTSKLDILGLLEKAKQWRAYPWLRPLKSSLQSPGGPLIRTLVHTSHVFFTVTSDSKHIVSVSGDGILKVWSTESGEELHTLKAHTGPGYDVSVTPDGRHAVSASGDNTLKVWNIESGEELHTLKGHTETVTTVAVTPDGKCAVSASCFGTLKVWSLESGEELHTLKGHTGWTTVAVTPNGKHAVSASEDHTLKVWNIESGEELYTLKGHTSPVDAVAVTPDSRHAISASDDGMLKVWGIENGEELYAMRGHTGRVYNVTVSPDNKHVVSASEDRTLKIWDLERGIELRTLKGHTDQVFDVIVTPDGKHVVSASDDSTLKVWNIESGEELNTLKGHAGGVTAVVVTLDGKCAVSASDDRTLKVWSLEIGEELHTMGGHTDIIDAITVTPDGKHAISVSRDCYLKVWSLESREELHTMGGHTDIIDAVTVTPDGRHAISASDDHTLKVWSIKSGEELHTLKGHTERVNAVTVTPDGRHAISASLDSTLKVWNIESGEELNTLKGHAGGVTAVVVTLDGKCAVSASGDSTLKVWSLESGEELNTLKGHAGGVTAVVVTLDGKCAVSASWDNTLKVWNIESGEELHTLKGHTGLITAIVMRPNKQHVISVSLDRTIKYWDLQKGEIYTSFSGEGFITAIAASPDGTTIVAGESSGRVHILKIEE